MEQATDTPLKKTPLNARHRASGAKMVPFGGWDMPVEYSGLVLEHTAVRTRAGVFDVSHMGEIEIAGKDALAAVQRISSNDASKLQVGQAQYSGLLTPQGTFVDDLLVYRLGPAHFLLVSTPATSRRTTPWMAEQIKGVGDAVAVDSSSRYALIALQGPAAVEILQPLTGVELAPMKYYWFAHGEVASVRATISRTGYTGEDGFEIFVPPQSADRVWQAILDFRPQRRRSAVRPRCARHASPRSGDAPLRQRHRRYDDGARGRSELDRRLEERRFCRGARRCASRRPLESRAKSSASRWWTAASHATATMCMSATRKPAS
jgi:sarcosine oxidase gamma subunit